MKKLFLYTILLLILASCSEQKIKKALENCADKKWFAQYDRGMFFKPDEIKGFKTDKVYLDAQKAQTKAQLERFKLERKLSIFKKNYEVDNPMPRMPKSVASQEEGLKALTKLTQEARAWRSKRDMQIGRKEMTIKMWKKKETEAFRNALKVKAYYADKVYKKMSIEKKSKLIFFVDLYGECEKEYQKLPNKFLIEYSK